MGSHGLMWSDAIVLDSGSDERQPDSIVLIADVWEPGGETRYGSRPCPTSMPNLISVRLGALQHVFTLPLLPIQTQLIASCDCEPGRTS